VHILVTGGTGHIGSYIIPELVAAGHQVTGLARTDKSAAAVSALGAKVRRGDISDLDVLKAAAAESDGVIHVAHRQDLLPSGGIHAVAAAELQIMLALQRGTGRNRKTAGRVGEHRLARLGKPWPAGHRGGEKHDPRTSTHGPSFEPHRQHRGTTAQFHRHGRPPVLSRTRSAMTGFFGTKYGRRDRFSTTGLRSTGIGAARPHSGQPLAHLPPFRFRHSPPWSAPQGGPSSCDPRGRLFSSSR